MIWRFLPLWLPLVALASPVSVDLHDVRIRDLVRVVYGEILKRSYVMDSAAVDDVKTVSMVLRNVEPAAVDVELRRMLDSQGLAVELAGDVLSVRRRVEFDDSAEVFVYRPLHRSSAYLMDLIGSMFPAGAFSSQRRGVGMNVSQVVGQGQGQAGVMGAGTAGQVPMINQGANALLDTEADALVFRGRPVEVERLKKMLAQLDIAAGEVMVKAVIYEVQRTSKEGSAVDLAVSILNGKLGLTISGGAAAAVSSAVAKFGGGSLNLSAAYAALSSDDRFKVVSAPRVRVRSGASARFSVGNETPILGSVSYDQNGRPIQSVTYKSSGVIFDLKPVVREGGVDMKIAQQISQFVQTTNGVNGTPTLIKRELNTDVTAADGEVVVIGGLDEDRASSGDAGFSFLPAFLRSSNNETQRTEVVLMLHMQRI